jgi:hypothetical protein
MTKRRIPDEVLWIIAKLRTGEMRKALSRLEDDAAAWTALGPPNIPSAAHHAYS